MVSTLSRFETAIIMFVYVYPLSYILLLRIYLYDVCLGATISNRRLTADVRCEIKIWISEKKNYIARIFASNLCTFNYVKRETACSN